MEWKSEVGYNPGTESDIKKVFFVDFCVFELYSIGGRLERPHGLTDRSGGAVQHWGRLWACVWASSVADTAPGRHASHRITGGSYSEISRKL